MKGRKSKKKVKCKLAQTLDFQLYYYSVKMVISPKKQTLKILSCTAHRTAQHAAPAKILDCSSINICRVILQSSWYPYCSNKQNYQFTLLVTSQLLPVAEDRALVCIPSKTDESRTLCAVSEDIKIIIKPKRKQNKWKCTVLQNEVVLLIILKVTLWPPSGFGVITWLVTSAIPD